MSFGALYSASRRRIPTLLVPSLGGSDGELEKLRQSPFWPAAKRLASTASRVGVLDPAIGYELADAGVNKDRQVAVRNGIDLANFHPIDSRARAQLRRRLGLPDRLTAVFVGQLAKRKGLVELLEAWPGVRRDYPDAELLVVGSGSLETEIRKAAARLDSGIRYLGERQDVSDLFRCADIAVLPSKNESLGCSFVEALASGTPLIAGRTGEQKRRVHRSWPASIPIACLREPGRRQLSIPSIVLVKGLVLSRELSGLRTTGRARLS